MSEEENKALMRTLYKASNEGAGELAKVRSLHERYFSPAFTYHSPSLGDMNLEQLIQLMVSVHTALPDLTFSADDMLADGDKVVARYTMQGTHKGAYRGFPATGKHIAIKGVEIDRIGGGKVLETWDFPDSLGLMTQLGAIPAPKK